MDYKITIKRYKDIYKMNFNEFLKGNWLETVREESKDFDSVEVEFSNNVLSIRKAKKVKEKDKE